MRRHRAQRQQAGAGTRRHPGTWDAYTEHLDGGFDEWWLVFSDANITSVSLAGTSGAVLRRPDRRS